MLIQQYKDKVYNTVLGIMQQPEDSEDVTQEVFISIYQNITQFRGDSRLSTWIYRIAVTKSLGALRKQKHTKGKMEGLERQDSRQKGSANATFYHPGIQLENKENAAVLFKALNLLPDNQKSAFILHKLEGLSYNEIAEVMNTTVSSIESLMFRARKNLQKLLANYYEQHFR